MCFWYLFVLRGNIRQRIKFWLNGTSSFHNNGMEGEVVGSRLIGCVCNLPLIIERIFYLVFFLLFILFYLIFMCSTLDEVKLKEKGRAFHDLFLTKVSIRPLHSLVVILIISAAKCQYLIFVGGFIFLNEDRVLQWKEGAWIIKEMLSLWLDCTWRVR